MPESHRPDFETLTAHLSRMIEAQTQLLETLARKREAIRSADGAVLATVSAKEGELAQQLITLEQQRRRLVQELLRGAGASLRPDAPLREIAALAPPEQAQPLLQTGARLRQLVEESARQNDVLREAGARLLGHLRHLATLMNGALDRAKTYGRAGRMNITPQLTTTVDIST